MGNFTENKITYLQMVQEIITRMSTISSVIKGFSITVIIGLCSIIIENLIKSKLLLLILYVPIICLLFIDVYYLGLERSYRYFYNCIRIDKKEVDFDLSLSATVIDKKQAKSNIIDCIKSKCIWGFYVPITIIYLVCCLFVYKKG